MQVRAFKSPYTGALFPTLEDLESHVLDHEAFLAVKAQKDADRNRIAELVQMPRLQAKNFKHFAELMFASIKEICQIEGTVSNIKKFEVEGHVRVDHYYQRRQKPIEFLGHSSTPTKRLVFDGDLVIVYTKNDSERNSALSRFPYVHLGCGNYHCAGGMKYDFFMFLDDFPIIRAKFLEMQGAIEAHASAAIKLDLEVKKAVGKDKQIAKLQGEVISIEDQIEALKLQKSTLEKKISKKSADIARSLSEAHGSEGEQSLKRATSIANEISYKPSLEVRS